MFADGMWIFYLEALLVLALGAFIVWWTMPKKRPPVQPTQAAQGAAPPLDRISANQAPANDAPATPAPANDAPASEAPAKQAAEQPASGNTARRD